MAKFLESLIFSLTFLALAAAGMWFGGPRMLASARDTLVAAAAEKQQLAEEKLAAGADAASADRRQTACLGEARGGMRAGRQIAAIVAPPATASGPRGLVTAAELQNVVGDAP